jgi:hypothetical protein
MFLKEIFEVGAFLKMKARLVANGRMQDLSVYTAYLSHTAKTRKTMPCLEAKVWELLKVDVRGAFLCTMIDEKVFILRDAGMAKLAAEWMPELKDYFRWDRKIAVRVDKIMCGLIQSAKLWYKELTQDPCAEGFQDLPIK